MTKRKDFTFFFIVFVLSLFVSCNLSTGKEKNIIKITSDQGLSNYEIDELAEIEGVTFAEPVYRVQLSDIAVESAHGIICDSLTEGRLIENENEALVSKDYSVSYGVKIGDLIELPGNYFIETEVKAVGITDNNNSQIYLIKDCFINCPVTGVFIEVDEDCYSDEIISSIEEKKDSITDEEIKRKTEIIDGEIIQVESLIALYKEKVGTKIKEYYELIDSKTEELDYYCNELEEARLLISEASLTIEDAEKQLEEGKAELQNAEKLIEEKEKQLDDAKKKYGNSIFYKNKIDDYYKQLEDGKKQYSEQLDLYNSKKSEYDSGVMELDEKKAEYEKGLVEYNDGKEKLELYKESLDEINVEYISIIDTLTGRISSLEESKNSMERPLWNIQKIK